MKKFLLRAENIMLILVFTGLSILEFFQTNSALDIHLYDTYYVINNIPFSLIFLTYSFIIYSSYFLLRNINRSVSKPIALIQIMGILILIFSISIPNNIPKISNHPLHHYDYSTWDSFKKFAALNELATIAAIFFIISQIVFFLYFIGILIKFRIKRI